MANKKVKFATIMRKKQENGSYSNFIVLGNKSKDSSKSKYDVSVEIIVRDNTGTVIAHQQDGFISVEDPRTRPDELLNNKAIDEAQYNKMLEAVGRIPDTVRAELTINKVV